LLKKLKKGVTVSQARKAGLKELEEIVQKAEKTNKNKVSTKATWASFIEEIKC
jgi:hypothetical protein